VRVGATLELTLLLTIHKIDAAVSLGENQLKGVNAVVGVGVRVELRNLNPGDHEAVLTVRPVPALRVTPSEVNVAGQGAQQVVGPGLAGEVLKRMRQIVVVAEGDVSVGADDNLVNRVQLLSSPNMEVTSTAPGLVVMSTHSKVGPPAESLSIQV